MQINAEDFCSSDTPLCHPLHPSGGQHTPDVLCAHPSLRTQKWVPPSLTLTAQSTLSVSVKRPAPGLHLTADPHTHTPVPPVKSKASLAFVVPESSQPDSCSWHWGGRIHITLKLMVCLWQSLQKRTRSQARGSSHLSQVGVMPLSPGYAFQPLLAVEPRAALLGPFTPSSPRTWPAGVTAQEGVGSAGGR